MKVAYRKRPSVGFAYLVLVAIATLAFFGWGLSRPRLEEVWRLDIELGLGKRAPLTNTELERLQSALIDYPNLAAFLTEDKHAGVFSANHDGKVEGAYAYLVRSPDAAATLVVSYAGARKKGAVSISARTLDVRHQGTTSAKQPYVWQLPEAAFPQLVELRFAPEGDSSQLHPVRIDLRSAP